MEIFLRSLNYFDFSLFTLLPAMFCTMLPVLYNHKSDDSFRICWGYGLLTFLIGILIIKCILFVI